MSEEWRGHGEPLTPPAPLTPQHDISGFDCGSAPLDDWLRRRALKNEGRFSRTYVVTQEDRVVAFYSLSGGSVDRASAPGRLARNAPEAIPVAIIGRLAVARTHAGMGLGADLLGDALRRIALAAQEIGIAAALVHAKDERAKWFYLDRAEFIEFPGNSRTLFLPVATILAGID